VRINFNIQIEGIRSPLLSWRKDEEMAETWEARCTKKPGFCQTPLQPEVSQMQEQNFAVCGCKRLETQLIDIIRGTDSKTFGRDVLKNRPLLERSADFKQRGY
jgi:hypothetical protein